MDIQHASFEFADHIRPEDSHEAGERHDIRTLRAQRIAECMIELAAAGELRMGNQDHGKSGRACVHKPWRIGAVADDGNNLGGNPSIVYSRNQCLQIATAPRNDDDQPCPLHGREINQA
jgi:hypothetical protein